MTLQSRTQSQTALGGVTESFSDIATVWARWVPDRGSQSHDAQQRIDHGTGAFEIRYRSDVDQTDEVAMGTKRYEVLGAPEEIGRREGLRLRVRRRDENGS